MARATCSTRTHEAFGDAAHIASNITEIGDGDPLRDVCSNSAIDQVTMAGKNIGDLLNAKGITWGSFMGGFDLTAVNADGTTGCARQSTTTAPGTITFTSADYIPHHAWFQYYASTANPHHARPSSVAAIGHSLIPHTNTPDPANHQYDINDFFAALKAGNLPAVSFLKAAAALKTDMPDIRTRSTSSISWFGSSTPCRRARNGRKPRWSFSMTTPTAGTIIKCRRS